MNSILVTEDKAELVGKLNIFWKLEKEYNILKKVIIFKSEVTYNLRYSPQIKRRTNEIRRQGINSRHNISHK